MNNENSIFHFIRNLENDKNSGLELFEISHGLYLLTIFAVSFICCRYSIKTITV